MIIALNVFCAILIVLAIAYEIKRGKKRKAETSTSKKTVVQKK